MRGRTLKATIDAAMAGEAIGPGTLLGGDFRLVGPLSSGGMGALFVAEQLSTGRRRAVKVMHATLADSPALRDRFAREAKVGSLVESDHVVEVIAAGVDPGSGAPFIAMELLEGEDLAASVSRNGPAPPSVAFEILRQVCHALGAAHEAGVVHRDVKPENVFLVSTKSAALASTVKVLDFGIAKIAAQMATAHTGVIGTPLWMAPEQTDPGAEAGPAADVWALGLLAFWLMTGKHFWRSAAIPSSSMHALMREILFDPIPLASRRAAELGAAGRISPELDAWFARCLERDPTARFANANEAFRALTNEAPSRVGTQAQTEPPPRQAPEAPTLVAATLPKKKPSSPALWLAVPVLAFGALLVGALGLGAGWYFGLFESEVSPPAATTPPAAATAAPAPPPPEPPEPEASAEAPAAKPASAAPAPAPKPKSAPPKPKPFDQAAAQKELAQKASFAKLSCSKQPGPRAFSLTVVFRSEGVARRVNMSGPDRATGSGSCVAMIFAGSRVPPFDGPDQSVGAGVALD